MNPLLVATRSAGKQAEFRTLLAAIATRLRFPDDIGLREDPAEDELEVHDTFVANARAKARWFAARSGMATVADDSGLEVDALGGAPGVRSKRYAGLSGSDATVSAANNAALLRALSAVPAAGRTARFRCALVYRTPAGGELVALGTTEGTIATAPRGAHGFGYDPLFVSSELGRTFGEVDAAAKGTVSHRARAAAALLARLA